MSVTVKIVKILSIAFGGNCLSERKSYLLGWEIFGMDEGAKKKENKVKHRWKMVSSL